MAGKGAESPFQFTVEGVRKSGINLSSEPSLQRLVSLQAKQRNLWHESNRIQEKKQEYDSHLLEIELRQKGIKSTEKSLKFQQDELLAKEKDLQNQLREEVKLYGEAKKNTRWSAHQELSDEEIVEDSKELQVKQKNLRSEHKELLEILNENQSKQDKLQKMLQALIQQSNGLEARQNIVQIQLQAVEEQLNENEAKVKSIAKQKKLESMLQMVKEESIRLLSCQQKLMEESTLLQAQKHAAGRKVNEIYTEQQTSWVQLQEAQQSLTREIGLLHPNIRESCDRDSQSRDASSDVHGDSGEERQGCNLRGESKNFEKNSSSTSSDMISDDLIQKFSKKLVSPMNAVMKTLDDAIDRLFEGKSCG